MELETLTQDMTAHTNGMGRLKTFRNDFKQFEELANKLFKERRVNAQMNSHSDRQELFGKFEDDLEMGASDRLLAEEAGNARLERSKRMALEAEEIGASVLTDLRRQREQIQNSSRALHGTDHDLDSSNRILRDMLRRAKANRLITFFIIALLCFAILFVMYHKIFH